eukprot:3935226-Rhodomonas_salina.4
MLTVHATDMACAGITPFLTPEQHAWKVAACPRGGYAMRGTSLKKEKRKKKSIGTHEIKKLIYNMKPKQVPAPSSLRACYAMPGAVTEYV